MSIINPEGKDLFKDDLGVLTYNETVMDEILGSDIQKGQKLETGTIGNWKITADRLIAQNGLVGMDSRITSGTDWRFWAGNVVPGSAPVRVDEDGNLYADSAVIGGSIIGASIHIPDEDTTANSFHVESDGDAWWGCTQSDWTADEGNAIAYVKSDGEAKFKDLTARKVTGYRDVDIKGNLQPTEILEAGENMSAGDAYCILGQEEYEATPTDDAYIKENDPNSNFGTAVELYIDSFWAGQEKQSLVKFDLSSLPTVAEKAFIRFKSLGAPGFYTDVHRVTSSWSEGSVTWNTQPTYNGTPEIDKAWFSSSGYIYIDITVLYNQWQAGTYDNYGIILIEDGTAGAGVGVYSSEEATTAYRPTLLVLGVNSNAGKAYKADADDYSKAINFRGFVTEDVTSGNDFQGQIGGVYDGMTDLIPGYKYYLTDTAGDVDITPGTFQKECGIATSATDIAIQKEDTITAMGVEDSVSLGENAPRYFVCGFRPRMIVFEFDFGGTQTCPKDIPAYPGADYFLQTATWISGDHIGIQQDTITTQIEEETDYLFHYVAAGGASYGIKIAATLDTGFILEFVAIGGTTLNTSISFNWYAYK